MPDRIIRESICTSETLNRLSDFEERFWHRLIVNCDDFGRFYANPAILRGKLFPLSDGKTKKDMSDALNKLASVGLVELYTVDGKPFLHVAKWSKYQRTRAKVSKFPAPEDGVVTRPDCEMRPNGGQPPALDNICCQATAYVPVFECECENRESRIEGVVDARARAGDSAVSAVFNAYFEKIGTAMTDGIRDDLLVFLSVMGPECCIRAFDAAVEANKVSWNYVKRVLENKRDRGVRSIEDWDREEEKHHGTRGSAGRDAAGSSGESKSWNLRTTKL